MPQQKPSRPFRMISLEGEDVPPKRRRKKSLELPPSLPLVVARKTLPGTSRSSKSRYSIAERSAILDYLARGWPISVVMKKLQQEQQLTPARETIQYYQKVFGPEIAQRREAWLAEMRSEPLANPRDRVRELIHQYKTCLAAMFRIPCPMCLAQGIVQVRISAGDKGKVRTEPRSCPDCRGRKYRISDEGKALLDELGDDVRFDTLSGVLNDLNYHGDWMDRAQEILRQIREEVGDAWSPRDKGQTGPDEAHLHLHGETIKDVNITMGKVLSASPDQIVAMYQARSTQKVLPSENGGSDVISVQSNSGGRVDGGQRDVRKSEPGGTGTRSGGVGGDEPGRGARGGRKRK